MAKHYLSLLFFLVGLVLCILVHTTDYRQSNSLLDSFHAVDESQQALNNINKLASVLKDVQRAHRGYVLTRNAQMLDTYENAIDKIPQLTSALHEYIKSNRDNSRDFDSLRSYIEKNTMYVERELSLVKKKRLSRRQRKSCRANGSWIRC
jgi:CHASE3 domain sensor protein